MLGMRDVGTAVSLNRWHRSEELFPVALRCRTMCWFCLEDAYVWVVCGFSFVFFFPFSFLSFVVFCCSFIFPSFFCLLDPFVRHQFSECESGIALLVRP